MIKFPKQMVKILPGAAIRQKNCGELVVTWDENGYVRTLILEGLKIVDRYGYISPSENLFTRILHPTEIPHLQLDHYLKCGEIILREHNCAYRLSDGNWLRVNFGP